MKREPRNHETLPLIFIIPLLALLGALIWLVFFMHLDYIESVLFMIGIAFCYVALIVILAMLVTPRSQYHQLFQVAFEVMKDDLRIFARMFDIKK